MTGNVKLLRDDDERAECHFVDEEGTDQFELVGD